MGKGQFVKIKMKKNYLQILIASWIFISNKTLKFMRIATNGVPEKVLREEKVSSQLHYKLYEYGRYLLPEITFSNKLH